jgi:hypothetical protein
MSARSTLATLAPLFRGWLLLMILCCLVQALRTAFLVCWTGRIV